MKIDNASRRKFIYTAGQLSAATLLISLGGCSKKTNQVSCTDTSTLSDSELSLRSSLQYTDQATESSKTCSGCAYFSTTNSDCGHCKLFNGSVSTGGHCSSWSPKA